MESRPAEERPVEELRKLEAIVSHFGTWLDALAADTAVALKDSPRAALYVPQLIGQVKLAITDFLLKDTLPVVYQHTKEDLEVGGRATTVKERKERERPQQ